MILRIIASVGLLIFIALGAVELTGEDSLEDLSGSIRARFPQVSTISPAALADWMGNPDRSPPFILDVREDKEYAVSHLPGALRAQPDAIAQLRQLGATPKTPVVVYCSVGYRSALLAQELTRAGFSHVQNLEGSIFAWANQGRQLVNSQGPTQGAHPFNAHWGRYLTQSKWRWEPPSAAAP